MILWRLYEDNRHTGLLEGSCISEEKYKEVFFSDKCLYSPIQEFEIRDFIEYKDDEYCIKKGIEKMLFYNERELQKFLEKIS